MKKFFLFSLIILFFIKTQNVFGNSGTFTVDNVEVMGDIIEQNSRKKYLDRAFKKAYQKLIISIIRTKDQKVLLSTNLKTIKSLVSNYRIIEEKNINNKYKLKTEVTFDRNKIGKFLQKKNISYSEIKKLEMIIYPILITNSELQIFQNNNFFVEWNKKNNFENINFILPVENVEDISFIKEKSFQLEEIDLSRLVDNYEIKNSAILVLRYDKNNLSVFMKTNLDGVKKSKKVEFKLENLDNRVVTQDIINNLKIYINELWKEENLIDISAPSYITVNAGIENTGSLKKILEKIDAIGLIQNYSVKKLDNKSAKIKIKFFGKINNLQNSLIDSGFEFKILNDEWILSLTG